MHLLSLRRRCRLIQQGHATRVLLNHIDPIAKEANLGVHLVKLSINLLLVVIKALAERFHSIIERQQQLHHLIVLVRAT